MPLARLNYATAAVRLTENDSSFAGQLSPPTSIGVGDPITLMDSDPSITFMKVIVTFYLLLWIRLLFSFTAIWASAGASIQVQVFSDMNLFAACVHHE